MTETQTPACKACGDTGMVPPFMDDCTACNVAALVDTFTVSAAPAFFPLHPKPGALVTNHDGTFVYTDDGWKNVPTETLTATEYAAKYRPVRTDEVVTETLAAAEGFGTCPACGGDGFFLLEDDDGDFTEQCVSCRGTGLHPNHLAPLRSTTEEVPAVPYVSGASDGAAGLDDDRPAIYADEHVPAAPPFKPITDAPDYAAGYGEAGIYSDPSISYGSSKPKPKLMTEAQDKLLTKLVDERDPANPTVAHVIALIAADGLTTAKKASGYIDALMKVPADPKKKAPRPNSYDGTCTYCAGSVPAGTGRIVKMPTGRWATYHLDGLCLSAEDAAKAAADRVTEPGLYKVITTTSPTCYRVRKSRMSDRLYGELITMQPDGTVGFAYNANAMSILRASDKLTWKEARDFGVAYGACIACGRTLSDARSLVQGYGPTCGSRYHWPLVTTKQAEAIIAGVMTWEEVTGLAV